MLDLYLAKSTMLKRVKQVWRWDQWAHVYLVSKNLHDGSADVKVMFSLNIGCNEIICV